MLYYQFCMEFTEWLDRELNDRGWSRSEAARRGGISASMFDKVINGYAQPGLTFYKGVAKAFKIPLEEVLRKAGEMEDLPNEEPPNFSEWMRLFLDANRDERDRMLEVARTLSRRSRKVNP